MPPPREYRVIILNEMLFIWIFLLIILSWYCIDVLGRAINNFTFVTLRLNEKSTYDTFVIAFCVIAIVVASVIFLRTCNINLEEEITHLVPDQGRNIQNRDETSFGFNNSFGFFDPL
jgi:uncharacterized membrane protein (DUF485 family)